MRTLQLDQVIGACVNDVPYLRYQITPVNFSGVDATISFVKTAGSSGTPTYTFGGQPLDSGIPGLLWPEAAVDGNGRGIAWPGWSFDGTNWLYDASNGLRPTVTIAISVNPLITTSVAFPPPLRRFVSAAHSPMWTWSRRSI